MKVLWLIVILFLFHFTLMGKVKKGKDVKAVYATEKIVMDGKLSEKVWQRSGVNSFVQSMPSDGANATEKTEVWVSYDKDSLYIAARLYDSEPQKISQLLTRRDNYVETDKFVVAVDPYFDKRSGFEFVVSAAGSVIDKALYNDEFTDWSWDGIWEAETSIDDKGWCVEIRIPFSQLRFKDKKEYTWGINFKRFIQRKKEWDMYSWSSREESGYVSHFAKLKGLKNINTRRKVELVPYVVGKAAYEPSEADNPFKTGKEYSLNGGLDAKVGLPGNLTLDLTVNPDFGQVEVDPARINLSASESYYQEKRPFFIEGASIFRFGRGGANRNLGANWGNPSFFYSRRIGRSPQGGVDTDGNYKTPDATTILGAAKVTGKIGKGWNFGALSALTAREYADIDNSGVRSTQEVEPSSFYGVIRAQKEFSEGRHGLGFIATSVMRDLRTSSLKESLASRSMTFGIDGWTFLGKDKTWVISGWFGGSNVKGSKEKIADLQQSYPHYYQRPDAGHVTYNPNRTSLNGWAGRLTLNKQKGKFLFNAALGAISPGFDSRDMGFMWDGDVINGHVMMGYQTFEPGKIFRRWSAELITQRNYDFDGNKIGEQRAILLSSFEFLNYWGGFLEVSLQPEALSRDNTRGGPLMLTPSGGNYFLMLRTDRRNPVTVYMHAGTWQSKSGSYNWRLSPEVEFKLGSNITLGIEPSYRYNFSDAQWVTAVDDVAQTDTYGKRYIFGQMERKEFSCSIRFNWIFSPKMSLQAFIQPFISSGAYRNFKELAKPETYSFNHYGKGGSTISEGDEGYTIDPDGNGSVESFTISNPDYSYKSLRSTVVFRWEYDPGSTFYLVWTQRRSDDSHPGRFRFGRDFRDMLKADGENIFMMKFTYRFNL